MAGSEWFWQGGAAFGFVSCLCQWAAVLGPQRAEAFGGGDQRGGYQVPVLLLLGEEEKQQHRS